MRRLIIILIIASFFSISHAGSNTVVASELLSNAIDSLMEGRRNLISKSILMSGHEKDNFWILYDQYEEEVRLIIKDTANLTNRLSADTETLSDEQIDTLLDQLLETQNKSAELQNKYANKFRAILPPKKLVNFVGILFLF